MRTQVGIVGAGPAGLMLSHLLHRAGISSIIVEARSRAYCEARIRAGLIEQWAADMLVETGLGARMKRESVVHDGIYLCFDGKLHHINFHKLVGKRVTIYGQQEVVKDLIARRLADGGQILFECSDVECSRVRWQGAANPLPPQRRNKGGRLRLHRRLRRLPRHLPAQHSRPNAISIYERDYPFGWLGILAEAPPVADELIYAYHPRGFALVQHALVDAGALLSASARRTNTSITGRTRASGTSLKPGWAARGRCMRGPLVRKDRRADALVRRRADAITAACSSPATPPTSCRRPARRA